jgi:hypothetical protein
MQNANERSLVPFVADDESDFEMDDVDDSSYEDDEVVALQPNNGVKIESIEDDDVEADDVAALAPLPDPNFVDLDLDDADRRHIDALRDAEVMRKRQMKANEYFRQFKGKATLTKPINVGLKTQHAALVTAAMRKKLASVKDQFAFPKATELTCVFFSMKKANAGHRCQRGIDFGAQDFDGYHFCSQHTREVDEMSDDEYSALRTTLDAVGAPKPNLAAALAKAIRRA